MFLSHQQAQNIFLISFITALLLLSWSLRPGLELSSPLIHRIFYLEKEQYYIWNSRPIQNNLNRSKKNENYPLHFIEAFDEIKKLTQEIELEFQGFENINFKSFEIVLVSYQTNVLKPLSSKIFISTDVLKKPEVIKNLLKMELIHQILEQSKGLMFFEEITKLFEKNSISINEYTFGRIIQNLILEKEAAEGPVSFFQKILNEAFFDLSLRDRFVLKKDLKIKISNFVNAKIKGLKYNRNLSQNISRVDKKFLKQLENRFIKNQRMIQGQLKFSTDIVVFNLSKSKIHSFDLLSNNLDVNLEVNKKILMTEEPLERVQRFQYLDVSMDSISISEKKIQINHSLIIYCDSFNLDQLVQVSLDLEKVWIIKSCNVNKIEMNKIANMGLQKYFEVSSHVPFVEVHVPSLKYSQKHNTISNQVLKMDIIDLFNGGVSFQLLTQTFRWQNQNRNKSTEVIRPVSPIDSILSYRIL